MRLLRRISLWLPLLAACLPQIVHADAAVAFFYGEHPPVTELHAFDRIVVEPQHVDQHFISQMAERELYAYVSLGEIDGSRAYLDDIPASWRMGTNPAWGSIVIDQSRKEWSAFFIDRVITPLWDKGFRGFFLDTLDSYLLYSGNEAKRAKQQQGMVHTIKAIKARYPEARLFFNRGFELLPEVHELIDGVAAESLFGSWNALEGKYVDVSPQDHDWLVTKLQEVRDRYQLPITVIDYVAPKERQRAREIADKITTLGFTPWVSNSNLDMLGVGTVEVMPRKIMMLYDYAEDETALMGQESVVIYGTLPLNYLGYAAEYHDVRKPLPQFSLQGRYAGVVVWLQQSLQASKAQRLVNWLHARQEEGVPLLLLGTIDFIDDKALPHFGLQRGDNRRLPKRLNLSYATKAFGYETAPLLEHGNFFPLALPRGTPWAVIEDDAKNRQVAAAITPWGGYVLDPLLVITLPGDNGNRWVIDPFTLYRQALRLPEMPVPDLTTESGRRSLLIHMDGDGFASKGEFPGNPYASEVLRDKILKRYPLPASISIIEGELSTEGLYPQLSAELEPIARSIYALPNVELASHSFSHPFNWGKVVEGDDESGYNLPIPNYKFDLQREVNGSVNYIESRLAPPGKTATLFFWTGNCNPPEAAVAQTVMAGVGNINGGDTVITNSMPSVTAVAPIGMYKGRYFQVFAPNQNENVYTNNWTGPFYGYRRVIETFEMTDKPLRLKPINIYFHTYSTSKPSSLAALDEVYRWALKQPTTPIFTSFYVKKAQQFDRVVVARHGEGWRVRGLDSIRELRLPVSNGIPDLKRSESIAGYNRHNDQHYIHAGASEVELYIGKGAPRESYLVSANASLTNSMRDKNGLHLSFAPQVALEIELANGRNCRLEQNGKRLGTSSMRNGHTILTVKKDVTGQIEANCGN